ncbi:MAG: polysaccharide pyruvyl transferase family protein, partial [Bryobacterales bacterium]|nr:polysaccharide pyruvyl transferase family protein [Bryobacterales bacterium]
MTPETVLISGYYGYSNTGDEAILEVILRELGARLGPAARFQVISGSPEETAAAHGVETLLWSDTAAIAEAVRQASLVVTGGGGIFHDYGGIHENGFLTEGNWGIGFHATAAILAALFEKPLALCAVGVGPLLSPGAGRYVRGVFEAANYASVRDADSRALAVEAGVAAAQVELTADPAFLLTPDPPERARAIFAAEGIPDPPPGATRVAIAIRHWAHEVDPEAWETELAQGLDRFAAAHPGGAQLVFVPFQRFPGEQEDDLTVARRVQARLESPSHIVEGRYQPGAVAALLAESQLVVAMRLHAAIFCLGAGVRFVALTYDGKVRHLLDRVERPDLGIPPGQLTADGLNAACSRALREEPVVVEPLRAAARETFDRIAALARDPRPARLTGKGRELLREGVLALTAREKFLRNWLSDQQTNYEYIVKVGKQALEESQATAARDRASAEAAIEAEQQTVAALREDKAQLEARLAERDATVAAQTQAIAGLEAG